jgi:hypothetical protein
VSFFMNKFRKLGLIDYNGVHRSPQFIVECRSARRAAYPDLSMLILPMRGHLDKIRRSLEQVS